MLSGQCKGLDQRHCKSPVALAMAQGARLEEPRPSLNPLQVALVSLGPNTPVALLAKKGWIGSGGQTLELKSLYRRTNGHHAGSHTL